MMTGKEKAEKLLSAHTIGKKARLLSKVAFVSQIADDHDLAAVAQEDAATAYADQWLKTGTGSPYTADYHLEMAAAHRRIAVRTRDTGERYNKETQSWEK